jgi:hypothetical protein
MSAKKQIERLDDQLSDPLEWDISQLIIETPVEQKLPNDPTLKAFNIKLLNKNKDGSKGRLLFGFERSPSLGISTKYGASLGLKMYDTTPSEKQQRTIEVINQICDKIKQFVVENKKDLKKPKITLADSEFKFLNPIKYKEDEDGNRMPDMAPLMNLKFLTGKDKQGSEIVRTFFSLEDEVDDSGNPLEIDWNDYVGKRCFATCLVRIDSVFVGNMISLRSYLQECDLKPMESSSGPKRFLRNNLFGNITTKTKVSINGDDDLSKQVEMPGEDSSEESPEVATPTLKNIQISDSEEESEPEPEPVKVETKKPAAKKVTKK